MEHILEKVSSQTGIAIEDILSKKRDGRIVHARHLFMYIARISGHSIKNITAFTQLSHSNISIQTNKIRAQEKIYKSLREEIEVIQKM